jgi:hypothetical protein
VGVGDLWVTNGTGWRRGRRGASKRCRRRNFPSPLRSLDRVRVRSVGRGATAVNFGTRAMGSPTPFYMRSATGTHQPQNGWALSIRARDEGPIWPLDQIGERSIQQRDPLRRQPQRWLRWRWRRHVWIDWPIIECRRLILHISEDIAFVRQDLSQKHLN